MFYTKWFDLDRYIIDMLYGSHMVLFRQSIIHIGYNYRDFIAL